MGRERSETHVAEFQAMDRGASAWVLRRARLADRHGADAIDHHLALDAADARVALVRREVALIRQSLGKPGLPRDRRCRIQQDLTVSSTRLQNAFRNRLTLDRPPRSRQGGTP